MSDFALKLMTCERHILKVWHPIGQPCPACHPELYPQLDRTRMDGTHALEPDHKYFIPAEAVTWPTKN